MADKIKPEDITFERLEPGHREIIKTFTCWQKDLVDFLVDDALANQGKGISVTYLFFLKSPRSLVGYVS
jgi:hypothetical protein